MRRIRVQSLADVITNSSSELFVVRSSESASFETLRSEIAEIVNDSNYKFYPDEDVDVYIANEPEHSDFWNYKINPGDLVIHTGENTLNFEGIEAVEGILSGHDYFRRHLG